MNRSKKSEIQNMRAYGARRQPGSGNSRVCAGDRGDGRIVGKMRIEQKDPMTAKFVVKVRDLDDLWALATGAGELGVYQVLTPDTRWSSVAILDADDFRRLCPQDSFICVGERGIRKQATFYLDKLNWELDERGHIRLRTESRDYVMTTKYLFDEITRGVLWGE